jgi:MauM/NapG family ferredoxin protein
MKVRHLQPLRVLTQIVVFGVFLLLLLRTRFTADPLGPVERFFHFDPLLGLSTVLASRTLVPAFGFALLIVALTVVLGRHACGWLCPFGAVLQFFSFVFKKTGWLKPKLQTGRMLGWKYVLALFVLVAAALTVNLAGLFDPLSVLYRSFAAAVLPAFSVAADGTASLLGRVGLQAAGDTLARVTRNLTFNATYGQGFLLGSIFLVLVALNASRERFWCRYVCPTGALLAACSRGNLLKLKIDRYRCDGCNACTLNCETQALSGTNQNWRPAECVYCYTCASVCPRDAVSFRLAVAPAPSRSIDRLRRRLVLAPALGALAVPLLRTSPSAKRPSGQLIRPPGALPEPEFLAKCIKCAECLKACPTNGLQPALAEAGIEGFWTPVLVPRIGYCEYYCTACTQACPTGAIREIDIKEKTQIRIGTAWVRTNRCVPYVLGETCTVCQESCPTDPKAIVMHPLEVLLPDGTAAEPRAPIVDSELCIGCGICETKCPVLDEPAIYCTNAGETRAERGGLDSPPEPPPPAP